MTETLTKELAVTKALELPFWKAPSNAEILGGGITNFNVKITDESRTYVVRLGEDIVEHGVMRFNELSACRAAHAAGVAPAVRYFQKGALVQDYIPAEPLSEEEIQQPEMLELIVALLGKVHRDATQLIRGPVLAFWVFHILRDYTETLRLLDSDHIPKLDDLMQKAQKLEAAVGKVQLVLCHNDLLPANILNENGRLWLVDWEYAGMNSPLFDLGGLATNASLTENLQKLLLAIYFDTPVSDELWERYNAMKCASLLRESMWSMVSEQTSKIQFDYANYTRENLLRFERAYAELQLK
ncbi:choline/ethanolamine kinase family protein [Pseudovibrio brasiliensis]|uniref:Phosphotransferase family protein n=1 Tax=Pseudovibrio brasiliensis TaxID=1898042 RepID=A0ABX8AU31_9HYPH|nr:choline/ethanolamine kinase family protein [Pseudovibrio brasiliensis]QUS57737.1 phosphotransferase family protein [Pseudovibrio brasiliensis]